MTTTYLAMSKPKNSRAANSSTVLTIKIENWIFFMIYRALKELPSRETKTTVAIERPNPVSDRVKVDMINVQNALLFLRPMQLLSQSQW